MADVTRLLRDARGILPLGVDREGAEAVVGVLAGMGIAAKAHPEDELPVLPEPKLLFDADPLPDGMVVQLTAEPAPPRIPWSRLRALSAGEVTITTEPARGPLDTRPEIADAYRKEALRDLLGPLAPLLGSESSPSWSSAWSPPPRPARSKRERVLVMDLVLDAPEDRLRVLSSRFVFDYLGERMALTSRENFRRLVTDIAGYAPDALLTGSTLSLLEDARPGAHHFGSPGEFDAYLRWAMAWSSVFDEES
jgi:hypothetical protein